MTEVMNHVDAMLLGAVAESLCGHAGVCVCQHFPSGAANSHNPRVPAQGRCQETRALVDGQQPGGAGNCCWSTQVTCEPFRCQSNHVS